MHWDLGMKGLAFLVVMSLGFGLIAQAVAGGATTRWLWVIASVAYFIGALFASEIWFGGATEEELQNVDGVSYDGGLLIGLVSGIVSVLVTWYVSWKRRHHRALPG